ncbi:hypothetical protein HYV69_03010 [Candidatus Uhrbacteria bacterium]|nr:hypothetical protein [Candidatus Uhrbacteria bacterium]
MIFPSTNPWMFERNEIDLLEEDLDEIYKQHAPSIRGPILKMEGRVLQEQLETEAEFEADLALRIGPEHLLSLDSSDREIKTFAKESLKEVLRAHTFRDPLYERVYLWAKHVAHYARYFYKHDKVYREDAFRALVNVKMIPIKLACVRSEFSQRDSVLGQIAKKEQRLCLTYFTRTLHALQNLTFSGDEEAIILFQEGETLQGQVQNERL